MYALNTSHHQAPMTLARLGLSHGYRIDGDSAALSAEIDVAIDRAQPLPALELQLWACKEPYQGGALSGFMVAETHVQPPAAPHSFWHDATAFARPPAPAGDYAMVLVLASRQGDGFQVVDFANYPRRERFVVPHMQGSAGYQLGDDGQVNLRVARVCNPRSEQNLSGSLVLQLWASTEPYAGGEPRGTRLASAELGQLSGQASLDALEPRSALQLPLREERHVALLLCEWTAEGYLVRDYCSFAEPYAGPRAVAAAAPAQVEADKPARVEAQQPARAEVETPRVEVTRPVAAAQPAPVEAPKSSVEATKPERPSLNTVGEAELMKLTGMPKKLAAELIRARPFQRFEQLAKVRGIGDKTVQRMRSLFTL